MFLGSYFGGIGNASAGNLKDAFLNDNQEALSAYKNSDFEKAFTKFKDKNWSSAASYRLGDFKTAVGEFESLEQYYNLGNALAYAGDIKNAIKAYEKELELNPDNEDAKFNKELLEKIQNNSDNKDSSQKKNSDEQNDKQDKDNNKQNSQDKNKDQQKNEQSDNQQKQASDGQQTEQEKLDKENENKEQNVSEKDENKAGEKEEKSSEEMVNVEDDSMSKEQLEKIQAREQQYKEIPEDAGGLLRSFIKKRYIMRRYND